MTTNDRASSGVIIAIGVLMLILGVIGLGAACTLTMTTAVFFGVLLVIGGVAGIGRAIQRDTGASRVWHILLSLAYIAGGVIAIIHPMFAGIAITLWIAIALVVAGVFQVVIALAARHAQGRLWGFLSGVASFILGAMIWSQWPASGIWVIGLFIAIELLMQGWAWIMGGLALRQAERGEAAPVPARS